jgi:hypothetical protein
VSNFNQRIARGAHLVDTIDVRGLPKEQAQLVQEFVDFLRRKLRETQDITDAEAQERDWGAGAVTSFTKDWENEEDAIYDNWREHYHVPEG